MLKTEYYITKTCEVVRDVLDFVYELTQLIKMSPKRLTLFESLRKEVTINSGELTPCPRMLCPTRWTVRHSSLSSILKNYSTIQSALDERVMMNMQQKLMAWHQKWIILIPFSV